MYFPGFICFVLNRPRYQVSVYRTNGPLVTHGKATREIKIDLTPKKSNILYLFILVNYVSFFQILIPGNETFVDLDIV